MARQNVGMFCSKVSIVDKVKLLIHHVQSDPVESVGVLCERIILWITQGKGLNKP
jgi:hypothetical protein